MKQMLVISAHGADWCTRAGGAILKYKKEGFKVIVFALTYGEHGESGAYWRNNPDSTVEKCKECRKEEALNAANALGVDEIVFFDYHDYPLCMDEMRIRDLTGRILDIRPEVILTHWIVDPFNLDHEITGKAVVRAVSGAGMIGARPATKEHFIPDLFFFETTMPHSEMNQFVPDTYLDIGDVFDKKIEAVGEFTAQPQLVEYYERCAKNRGVQATDWARGRRTITYAEAYCRFVPFLGDLFPLTTL